MKVHKTILPIIVIAQFFCTSLWFAGNAVLDDLRFYFELESVAVGAITSSVQIGFILGTLVFALFSIADRFSPSKVFMLSAILGGLCNTCLIGDANNFYSILVFRFLTGFFLAGIYPVGMKVAADYFDKGLGKSLGYLVGALVLGTAAPYLFKDLLSDLPWQYVIVTTSSLAVTGGVMMYILVADGPFRRAAQEIRFSSIFDIFKKRDFRAAAFGYFGHMWELYAFWAFVPVILDMYSHTHEGTILNVPLLSFFIIGVGGFSCVLSGYFAERYGPRKVATIALASSGMCCILLPAIFLLGSVHLFIAFLIFWGMAVIADSPMFSTLVARHAPKKLKGTALTIVNSIGFFLTIISIQLLGSFDLDTMSSFTFYILLAGPIFGLIALFRDDVLKKKLTS